MLLKKYLAGILCFFSLSFLYSSFSVAADLLQSIEISSTFNPVGSGSRAIGMGGAFIAVADDATAASWNPAGLVQLELPEVSIVGTFFNLEEDLMFRNQSEEEGSYEVSKSSLNYLSGTYPFNLLERNMIISASYQHLYDFSRDWDFTIVSPSGDLRQKVNYVQDGELSALGLSYCIQVTPDFSCGFTLNIWEDWFSRNGWEQEVIQKGTGYLEEIAFEFELKSHESYSFKGLNFNFGLLWNITPTITLGAVYKSPFQADIVHRYNLYSSFYFPDSNSSEPPNTYAYFMNEKLDMPMAYGIGLAIRFSDEFTASLDIYRTEWGEFILTDPNGNKISPISGVKMNKSQIDPTHQIRAGVEYLIITTKYIIPLRGGMFYDPSPAEGDPDDIFGFSLGSGIAMGRLVYDMAYQYRFGKKNGASGTNNSGFSQDIEEHMLYSSLIVHF